MIIDERERKENKKEGKEGHFFVLSKLLVLPAKKPRKTKNQFFKTTALNFFFFTFLN